MDERWTLAELTSEAATRIAALPAPTNGQVRAIPDERTIRYYGTIGLLDRPVTMRGRTALYGRRHLAQVVAIKRLQTTGSSLADIQTLWPSLDDATLSRMSGIAIAAAEPPKSRRDFWKAAPGELAPPPAPPEPPPPPAAMELYIELAPGLRLAIAVPDGLAIPLSPDDVRAIRASAATLVELTRRRLAATHPSPDRNEGDER